MKKYVVIAFILVLITIIYFGVIHKIDGRYTCLAYTMLDGGYSESYLVLKDGVITHNYIEPGKAPRVTVVGAYARTGFRTILVDHVDQSLKYSLQCGLLGLYMDDVDAAKLGIKFPRIGNIWFWRKIF